MENRAFSFHKKWITALITCMGDRATESGLKIINIFNFVSVLLCNKFVHYYTQYVFI